MSSICGNFNKVGDVADPSMVICVGFGQSEIWKDDELIFDGERSEEYKRLSDFEEMAKQDPTHEWKCVLNAPLSNTSWRRQGDDQWVCYESGMGFA